MELLKKLVKLVLMLIRDTIIIFLNYRYRLLISVAS